MIVNIAGDFCDRHRVLDFVEKNDFTTPLVELRSFVLEEEVNIVNFEFPIVLEGGKPINKSGPNLSGHKDSYNIIKNAGFNVCCLANNHILDQGEQCCIDTINILNHNGFSTVGAGHDSIEASKILYIRQGEQKIAIINCCEHEFSIASTKSAGANGLDPINQYYKITEAKQNAQFVLVIVHGGHEYYQLPSPRMQHLYRYFIDLGADAVINHHQHCYSGYEIYAGKPIVYGLGNLLFDDPKHRNDIWNYGYVVKLKFEVGINPQIELYPYRQCTESATLHLLTGSDLENFYSNINRLNSIICNPISLESEHIRWMNSTTADYDLSIQPYSSRLTRALYVRRLLPPLFAKKKKLVLENFIMCESHMERLLNAIRR